METRDKKAAATSKEMNKREMSIKDHIPTREDAKEIVAKRKEASQAKSESTKRTVSRKVEDRVHSTSHTKKQRVITLHAKKVTSSKKKKRKKKKKRGKKSSKKKKLSVLQISIGIALLFILITVGIIFLLRSLLDSNLGEEVGLFTSITIQNGSSATAIASLLEQEGIVDSGDSFLSYVQQKGDSQNLIAGDYTFALDSDYKSVHQVLSDVQLSPVVSFTIFDGSPIEEIDTNLAQRQLIAPGEFVKALEEESSRRNLSFQEGWILSDTYALERGPSVASTLAVDAIEAMNRELKKYSEEILKSDYSIDELLIIASMIQRETQDSSQMPIIARVIYNRLEQDEPLGIDATTRYALSKWDKPLEKGDFSKSKEYNTRTKKGLPPTGIGSVGKEALKAAIFPSEHDYLFYLHDSKGNLHLGKTYAEHLENSEKYL